MLAGSRKSAIWSRGAERNFLGPLRPTCKADVRVWGSLGLGEQFLGLVGRYR